MPLLFLLGLLIGALILARSMLAGVSVEQSARSWANQTIGTPLTLANRAYRLKEDQWQGVGVHLPRSGTLSVDVTREEGPEFDVYFMSAAAVREWDAAIARGRGEFRHFRELGGSSVTHLRASAQLEAGDYYLVLDNTDFGDTAPPMNMHDDVVVARVKIVVE